jgi:hypothetical protein
VAANTNLITSFIRRISKYFDSSNFTWPRPKRVAPGANHIDNPTDFDARTIYRGEEIVDFTQGKLYTQDGGEIVELNSPSQIIDGLRTVTPSVVGAFGGGALYVSVESGAVRINGKNYYHESAGGTAVNGDITIAPNTSPSKGRIDIIAAKSDYPNPAPSGIVGTFGIDSTEYAVGLTAIAGTLYNQGRALTFTGDYPGAGNTITISSILSATAISAGDAIIGPNISGTVTVTSVATSGGLITSIDISATPVAASTAATYAVSIYLGDVYAIRGDISAGSNTMVNVFPQPLLNDLIIGQGIPDGTIATNVATPGTVVLSNSATLTNPESIFQIGDVVDHILYDATTPWPNLPSDHVLLGLVYVPNSYTALSTPNTLRPWSVSDIWNSNNIENQTTKSLVNYYLSTIQEYSSDTTYMSGNTIIDPQTQSIARVIKNHYSSDLDASLNSGAIVKISSGGVGGGGGTPTLANVLSQGNSTGNSVFMSPDALTQLGILDGQGYLTCNDLSNYGAFITMLPSQIETNVIDTVSNDNTLIQQQATNLSLQNISASGTQINQVTISPTIVGIENNLSGIQVQKIFVDSDSCNMKYKDGFNEFNIELGLTNGIILDYNAVTGDYIHQIQIKFDEIKLAYDNNVGALNYEFKLTDDGFYLKNLPKYTDDADAGTAGLPQGYLYQTDGLGASPLDVAGILMIKQ